LPKKYKAKLYVKKPRKTICTKMLLVKCWSNWHLPAISSTFYACVFCTKFWCQKLQSWNVTRKSCAILFRTKKPCVKCWSNWHLMIELDICQACWPLQKNNAVWKQKKLTQMERIKTKTELGLAVAVFNKLSFIHWILFYKFF